MADIRKNFLLRLVFFGVVFSITCNMGDKDKSVSPNEPGFARLAEGEGSLRALVHDESTQCVLKDFSFFGHTTVGGIRRETDDSVTRFELSKIKEIKVLKPHYDSKRFGDKDFLLAEVTSTTGAVISDLLVPKKLIICGIDEKTGLEKSWFLQKVDRVVMQGATPLVLPSIPSALTASKNVAPTAAPLSPAPGAAAGAISTPVPTVGSQEKTKRTFRPAKENKWDKFYQENQLPQQMEQQRPKQGIGDAFIAIIDALIDFVKAIINGVLKLFR